VDHVIVGVADLDAGMQQLADITGVRPQFGGAHPGAGTRNALLSLGAATYLELYAPNPAEPVDSADVRELKSLGRLKPIGWAVSPEKVETVRAMMANAGLPLSPPKAGSRKRPDGRVLHWETFGYETFDHQLAPFFIRWRDQTQHPGTTAPQGCKLTSIHLFDPAPTALIAALQPLRLAATVERARTSDLEVTLACPTGTVVLR
jgi:hypothetical protein